MTRVTLRHGDLAMSPKTWESVRIGWVGVLDGMKTLLETGEPLPADRHRRACRRVRRGGQVAPDRRASPPTTAPGSCSTAVALTDDEADDLLGRAYAATYHWRRAEGATAVNAARGSWLVSRCHAVLGQGELALHHARRSIAHVQEAGDLAADFDHAYAHEATARALACLGRLDEARAELALANAVEIADPEDRAILESDLKSEPWFGL